MRGASTESRRGFLRHTGCAAAVTALTSAMYAPAYAAENNTIKIALVGCGGRGTGAAVNALSTSGPTQLHAMADVFPSRLQASLKSLKDRFGAKADVPEDRQFIGFDAFKKAIDSMDRQSVVLLATPAAFRPIHLEYAVKAGRHVFMEKSFAVEIPGARRVLAAGKLADEKGLKIATGLMWRHDPARQAAIKRIHDGAIGELYLLRTYRMHGAVGYGPRQPGESEVAFQIRNYNSFTWLNASFFVDWLIHNIDVCCWTKNDWPVTAQGHGGRSARTIKDQMFDHYVVEYTFPDGARLFAQGRHIDQTYSVFSDFAHGTRGSAVVMTNLSEANPRFYRGHVQTPENQVWKYDGPTPDPYQVEHDLLFEAIRQNKPYNETERGVRALVTSIMGRMAAESGQLISHDEAIKSNLELAPGLENLTMDGPAPVMPDADGNYPIPVPGKTRVL